MSASSSDYSLRIELIDSTLGFDFIDIKNPPHLSFDNACTESLETIKKIIKKKIKTDADIDVNIGDIELALIGDNTVRCAIKRFFSFYYL